MEKINVDYHEIQTEVEKKVRNPFKYLWKISRIVCTPTNFSSIPNQTISDVFKENLLAELLLDDNKEEQKSGKIKERNTNLQPAS